MQPKPYAFTYGVKDEYSGTDFSRAEERRGEVIQGSYKVALPDGRVQIVSYVADDDGYKATVSYEGEPNYPPPEKYKSATGALPYDVFHALPPVTADLSHALFESGPKVAVTPEPILYDEYEYYDEPVVVTPLPPKKPYTPQPTYASPTPAPYTPKPAYASPTPLPYTPKPVYASPTPKPYTPKPTYAPPTPLPYTPSPAYASPTPKPSYYTTPAPAYAPTSTVSPAYASPSYGPTPTPTPYAASPSTIKSLRPKKYGLKIPNYSTLGPHHIFYATTTYAPPVSSPYSTYKEVFKRKASPAPSINEYDYEYYEDSEYVYSPNRRSLNHQVQLVIAEHLHQDKK